MMESPGSSHRGSYGNVKDVEEEEAGSTEEPGCGYRGKRCCVRAFPTGYLPELKKTLNLTWGLCFMQLCALLIQPMAVIFGGRLGKLELDTIALSNTLINIIGHSIIGGMATACDTLFAQTFGSKNKKLVGIQLQRALVIHTLALCVCFAIHLNLEGLLRVLGQDHEVARMTGRYVMLFMPGMFVCRCLSIYLTICKYIQCQNIVLPNTIIGAIGLGSHILFQYIFVYVLKWGIDGSALAQVTGYFIMTTLTIIYIIASKMYVPTWGGLDRRLFLRWGEYGRLAIYGLLMVCLEWWAFEVTVILAGVLGTTELGAQTIVFNINSIPWAIPNGISIAVSIRIGQELGAGEPLKAKTASRVAYTITAVINSIIAVVILATSQQLPYIFTDVPEVIDLVTQIVPLLAYYVLIDALVSVARGIFRGCGKQGLATIIIFCGFYLLALPIGISLMFLTKLRVLGIWIGLAIGLTIDGFVYFVYSNCIADWELFSIQAQERAQVLKMMRDQDLKDETEPEPPEPEADETTGLLSGEKRKLTGGSLLQRTISRLESVQTATSGAPPVESGDEQVTTVIIVKRVLTSLLMLGILGAGVACRLLIEIPHESEFGSGNTTKTAFSESNFTQASYFTSMATVRK